MVKKPQVYTEGGSAGDILYSLAAVKDNGGGEFYINTQADPNWRMPVNRIRSLLSLMICQPYLTKVGMHEGVLGIDLDTLRRRPWFSGFNLSDMISHRLKIDHTSRTEPWLFVPGTRKIARVVMHRSPRYHVSTYKWKKVLEKYGKEAIFVGAKEEHEAFKKVFGQAPPYYYTSTYLELAEVIHGCDIFCGNQSSPAAVAQGLRKVMVQETVHKSHWAWNCHWGRPGMYHDTSVLPDL